MNDVQEQILELVKEANPQNPLRFVQEAVKDYANDKLNDLIANCKDCENCGHKTFTRGNTNASVMIIGEKPSVEQILSKTTGALEDESGEILEAIFDKLNVNKDEIFYINSVNCWPYKNVGRECIARTPNKQEIKNCKVFIDHAIKIVQPLVIITLGNVAMNTFADQKEVISKIRGNFININGIPLMPTYHPNYFKQLEGHKDEDTIIQYQCEFFEDIKTVFKYIQKNYPDNNIVLKPIE